MQQHTEQVTTKKTTHQLPSKRSKSDWKKASDALHAVCGEACKKHGYDRAHVKNVVHTCARKLANLPAEAPWQDVPTQLLRSLRRKIKPLAGTLSEADDKLKAMEDYAFGRTPQDSQDGIGHGRPRTTDGPAPSTEHQPQCRSGRSITRAHRVPLITTFVETLP